MPRPGRRLISAAYTQTGRATHATEGKRALSAGMAKEGWEYSLCFNLVKPAERRTREVTCAHCRRELRDRRLRIDLLLGDDA